MFRIILFIGCLLCLNQGIAQVFNSANLDTNDVKFDGKLSIHGFVDAYYLYDFNQPKAEVTPYQVSSNRHNEVNINLVYVAFRYNSSRIRAAFVPAFGTYINTNYASEPQTLKNLLEANAGIKLFKNREIWLDVGVMASPITNESPVSKDQFLYSRSMAAEYSPYFVTGAKLSIPVLPKLSANFFLLNGWQQTVTHNSDKSLALQLEFRPTDNWLFDLNLYSGNAANNPRPDFRQRHFIDFYSIYQSSNKRFNASIDAYYGIQNTKDSLGIKGTGNWWNMNFQTLYWLKKNHGIGGRLEYLNDPQNMMVTPLYTNGFQTAGITLAYNYKVLDNCMLRLDCKYYESRQKVFLDSKENASYNSIQVIGNFSVWF
jgi:hypothetical protein